jgi:hypothetical protein
MSRADRNSDCLTGHSREGVSNCAFGRHKVLRVESCGGEYVGGFCRVGQRLRGRPIGEAKGVEKKAFGSFLAASRSSDKAKCFRDVFDDFFLNAV